MTSMPSLFRIDAGERLRRSQVLNEIVILAFGETSIDSGLTGQDARLHRT